MQGKDGNILTYAYIHPQKVIWTSKFGLPLVCYAKVQMALICEACPAEFDALLGGASHLVCIW